MLIRFSVENFLSFKDEVEFSMVPGESHQHSEHIIAEEKSKKIKILKTAVIYGANASGKSNLIKAMSFAQQQVINGVRARKTIQVTPFKFDAACVDKPSKFQFEFRADSKFYIYGFTLDTQRIHEEWLYEISPTTEKDKLIFERKTNVDGETAIEFSKSDKRFQGTENRRFLEFTARGTRPNQLFLTESIERNIKYFEDVFIWFDLVLVLLFPESRRKGVEVDFIFDKDFRSSLRNLLQDLDTGISGIDLKEFNLEEESSIPPEIKDQVVDEVLAAGKSGLGVIFPGSQGRRFLVLKDEQNELKALKLMTAHDIKGENQSVLLEVSEESDGTQRLFDIIPALLDLLNSERVIVIDELDRSLHPHLSYKILELFLKNKPEQRSQLIVTTHESTLLDLDLLRRDEIWFLEKNKEGASTVYSLEEFAPRKDKDIRKGYLQGRFGAIPFLKSDLTWVK